MYCGDCGAERKPGSFFCGKCGSSGILPVSWKPDIQYDLIETENRICPHCGQSVPDGFRFCGACGTEYQKPEPVKMPHCVRCGASMTTSAQFCNKCGLAYAEDKNGFVLLPSEPCCTVCGAEIVEGTEFCVHCGNRIVHKEVRTHLMSPLCPHCGHKVHIAFPYCTNCGRDWTGRNTDSAADSTEKPYEDRTSLRCPVCGHMIEPDDNFCINCGSEYPARTVQAAVPDPSPSASVELPAQKMQSAEPCCKGCGSVLIAGASFCPYCGQAVPRSGKTEPSEQADSAEPSSTKCNDPVTSGIVLGAKKKRNRRRTVLFFSLAALILGAIALLYFSVFAPKLKIVRARKLIETGDYDTALVLLQNFNSPETNALVLECLTQKYGENEGNARYYYWACVQELKVGDSFTFGHYEQDCNFSNGTEKIEWIVLDKKDASILIVSKYGLDDQQYCPSNNNVTWESSYLREWLNLSFYLSAFNSQERCLIRETEISDTTNKKYHTNAGSVTRDRIFLLSVSEVKRYFSSDYERRCAPTEFSKLYGSWSGSSNTTGGRSCCGWWLRTPGSRQNDIATVTDSGAINESGVYGNFGLATVRPALWLDPLFIS